jgi:iron(III) transport system substrate-binding protein
MPSRKAGGGDRDVARDIVADLCDIGLANSYYVGLMRTLLLLGAAAAAAHQPDIVRVRQPDVAEVGDDVAGEYKGEVCLRSGQHPYNTALIAAYLVKHGEEKTEAPLRPGLA